MSSARDPQPPDITTRQRLLDAAQDLFTSRGFEATGTREIAAQAGCNLSLIKYYFGSKEGLLREVLSHYIASVGDRLQEAVSLDGSAEQRVEAIIGRMIEHMSRNAAVLRLIFREVCSDTSPVATELRERILRNQTIALALFTQGQADGSIKALPPRLLAAMISGMLMFYFVGYPLMAPWVGEMTPELQESMRRTAVEIVLRGILVQPEVQPPTAGVEALQ